MSILNWLYSIFVKPLPPIPPPTKEFRKHHISAAILRVRITAATGIRPIDITLRDDHYWFTDSDVAQQWAWEALQNCPPYTSINAAHHGYDCDKFSSENCSYVHRTYQMNDRIEVWGTTPKGYHSWVIIITPDGLIEQEPQNCDAWNCGSRKNWKIKEFH